MKLLRKFFAAPLARKALLLRAFGLVVMVRVALWVLPYRTVRRLALPPLRSRHVGFTRTNIEEMKSVATAVQGVGKRLLGDKPCLVQAIVAQRMLRQRGYATDFRIGVTKDGSELLAHAWLERDGYVVIGGGHSPARYKTLAPLRAEAV